jgi:hypothetical protein
MEQLCINLRQGLTSIIVYALLFNWAFLGSFKRPYIFSFNEGILNIFNYNSREIVAYPRFIINKI